MSIQKNLFFVSKIFEKFDIGLMSSYEDFLIALPDDQISYLFTPEEEKNFYTLLLDIGRDLKSTSLQDKIFEVFSLRNQENISNLKKKEIPSDYTKPERLMFFSELSLKEQKLYIYFTTQTLKPANLNFVEVLQKQGLDCAFACGYNNVFKILFETLNQQYSFNFHNEQIVSMAKTFCLMNFDYFERGLLCSRKDFLRSLDENFEVIYQMQNLIFFLKRIEFLKRLKKRSNFFGLQKKIYELYQECSGRIEKVQVLLKLKVVTTILFSKSPLLVLPSISESLKSEIEELVRRKCGLMQILDFFDALSASELDMELKFFEDSSFLNFSSLESLYNSHRKEIDSFFECLLLNLQASRVTYFSMTGFIDTYIENDTVFTTFFNNKGNIAAFTFDDLDILSFSISGIITTIVSCCTLYGKKTALSLYQEIKWCFQYFCGLSSFDLNALSLYFKELEGFVLDKWCSTTKYEPFCIDIFQKKKVCLDLNEMVTRVSKIFLNAKKINDLTNTAQDNAEFTVNDALMITVKFFRFCPPRRYEVTSVFKECARSFSQMGQFSPDSLENLKLATTFIFLKFYYKCYNSLPKSYVQHLEKNCPENLLEVAMRAEFAGLEILKGYKFSSEGKDLFTDDCWNEKDARNVPNNTTIEKGAFDKQDIFLKREYLYFSKTSHEEEKKTLMGYLEQEVSLESRISLKPEPKDSGRPFGMEPVCVRNYNSVVQNNLFKVSSVSVGSLLSRSMNSKLEIIKKALDLVNSNKQAGFKSLFMMTDFSKFGNSIPFLVTQSIHEIAANFFGVPLIKNYLNITKNYIHVAKFEGAEAIIKNPLHCDNQGQRNGTWQVMLAAAPYFLLDNVYNLFPDLLSKSVPIFPIFFEDDHMFVIPFRNSFFKKVREEKRKSIEKNLNFSSFLNDFQIDLPSTFEAPEKSIKTTLLESFGKSFSTILHKMKKRKVLDIELKLFESNVVSELNDLLLKPIAEGYNSLGLKMQKTKCTFSLNKFSLLGDAFLKTGIFPQPFKGFQSFFRKSDRLVDSWNNLVSDATSISSSNVLAGNNPTFSFLNMFCLFPFKAWICSSKFLQKQSLPLYVTLFFPPSLGFASFPLPHTNIPGMYPYRDIDYFHLMWLNKDNKANRIAQNMVRNIINQALKTKLKCCEIFNIKISTDWLKKILKKKLIEAFALKSNLTEESKKMFCNVICSLTNTKSTFREHLKTLLPDAKFKETVAKICTSASAKDLVNNFERVELTKRVNREYSAQIKKCIILSYNSKDIPDDLTLLGLLDHCFHDPYFFLNIRPSFDLFKNIKKTHIFGSIFLAKRHHKSNDTFLSFGEKASSSIDTYPLIPNKNEKLILSLTDIVSCTNNLTNDRRDALVNFFENTFNVELAVGLSKDNLNLRLYRDIKGLQIMSSVHSTWMPQSGKSLYPCLAELDEMKKKKNKVFNYGVLHYLLYYINSKDRFLVYKNSCWTDNGIDLKDTFIKTVNTKKKLLLPKRITNLIEKKSVRLHNLSVDRVLESREFGLADAIRMFDDIAEKKIVYVKELKQRKNRSKELDIEIRVLKHNILMEKKKEKKENFKKALEEKTLEKEEIRRKIHLINSVYGSPILEQKNFDLEDLLIPLDDKTRKLVSQILYKAFIAQIVTRLAREFYLKNKSITRFIQDLPATVFVKDRSNKEMQEIKEIITPTTEEVSHFLEVLRSQKAEDCCLQWMNHYWEHARNPYRDLVNERFEKEKKINFIKNFVSTSFNLTIGIMKDLSLGFRYGNAVALTELFLSFWVSRWKGALIERVNIRDWAFINKMQFKDDINCAIEHGVHTYAALVDFFETVIALKKEIEIDKAVILNLISDFKVVIISLGNVNFFKKKEVVDMNSFISFHYKEVQCKMLGICFALEKLYPFFLDFGIILDLQSIPEEKKFLTHYQTGFLHPTNTLPMKFLEEDWTRAIRVDQVPLTLFNQINKNDKYFFLFQGQKGKTDSVKYDSYKDKTILKPIPIPNIQKKVENKVFIKNVEEDLERIKGYKNPKALLEYNEKTMASLKLDLSVVRKKMLELRERKEKIFDESENSDEESLTLIENEEKELIEKESILGRQIKQVQKRNKEISSYSIVPKSDKKKESDPKKAKQIEKQGEVFKEKVEHLELISHTMDNIFRSNTQNLTYPDIEHVQKLPSFLLEEPFETLDDKNVFSLNVYSPSQSKQDKISQHQLDNKILLNLPERPEVVIEIAETKTDLPKPLVEKKVAALEIEVVKEEKKEQNPSSVASTEKETKSSISLFKETKILKEGTYKVVVEDCEFVSDEPLSFTSFNQSFFVHPANIKPNKIKAAFVRSLPDIYKVEYKRK